ncbi:MAG: type II secretion system F family protein [Novosphingobium sp.]
MLNFIAINSLARLAVLTLLFAVVAGVCTVVFLSVSRRTQVRRELQAIAGSSKTAEASQSLHQRRDDAWSQLADRIEKTGLSLADTKSSELREKLIAAGFASPAAPRIYTLLRLLLVIVLPASFVGLTLAGGGELSFMKLYIYGSIFALLGLYLPALIIRARADRRREQIIHGFPDSLDLLLVCVEAGLSLEAALDRVGREMSLSHPLVSSMLTTATLQLRAGASREVALRRMADSVKVDEINSFATLLIQSDKFGSSVADTLRVYSDEMRERRRLRAEEKAHRIPVLISVPLVACMLPVMIGVLMLPAAVRVVRQILPSMAGG